MSGSVLTAQSLEPALDSMSPSLSAPPLLILCLSLSKINKTLKKIKKKLKIKKKKHDFLFLIVSHSTYDHMTYVGYLLTYLLTDHFFPLGARIFVFLDHCCIPNA